MSGAGSDSEHAELRVRGLCGILRSRSGVPLPVSTAGAGGAARSARGARLKHIKQKPHKKTLQPRAESRGETRVWSARRAGRVVSRLAGNVRRRAPLRVETDLDLAGRWAGDGQELTAALEQLEGAVLLRAVAPRAEATAQQVARELRDDLLHDGAAQAE